jgi:hypothetical protein
MNEAGVSRNAIDTRKGSSYGKLVKIIVIIIVILVVLYFSLNIKIAPKAPQNVVHFDEIRNQMKTGDVITMNTSHLLKRLVITNYLGCDAIHIAMVVRVKKGSIERRVGASVRGSKDSLKANADSSDLPRFEVETSPDERGELYLIELGPYGKWPYRKSDVRFSPLSVALGSCSYHTFGYLPVEKELSFTDGDLAKYMDYKYNYFVPTMFSPYKKYKICSSFVAEIHHDKGLGRDNPHLRTPCEYRNHRDLQMFQI